MKIDWKELNWEMASFFLGASSICAYLFNPILFVRSISKPSGPFNYYDLHASVQELKVYHAENNSPIVKDLQAKIKDMEQEKEMITRKNMEKIEGLIVELRKEIHQVKLSIQK